MRFASSHFDEYSSGPLLCSELAELIARTSRRLQAACTLHVERAELAPQPADIDVKRLVAWRVVAEECVLKDRGFAAVLSAVVVEIFNYARLRVGQRRALVAEL